MLDSDSLPLDEVGRWVKEKHERLLKYVDATHAVRKKFIKGKGGASYIDLYCGSGRSVIRETGEIVDGSPLVAFKCAVASGAPFTELYIADEEQAQVEAAESRLKHAGATPKTFVGKAVEIAPTIVAQLNPLGLHFAFLDPYNLDDLPFAVVEALSSLKRVDMLIHVSAQDLQRNLDEYTRPGDQRLERFAPGWRDAVDLRQTQKAIRARLLECWIGKMSALGLPPARGMELIVGSKNQPLYWLALVSRHRLAHKIWESIANVSGQKSFDLD